MTLVSLLAATTPLLGFEFCLDYSVNNSFATVSVCETPTREINHTSAIWLRSFLFFLMFFDSQARISLHGEVTQPAHS
jgi:hypothetical protein